MTTPEQIGELEATLTAAFAAASRAFAGLAAEWQRLCVVVSPQMRRSSWHALLAAEFNRLPRHREVPEPGDVHGWLEQHSGGELHGMLLRAYLRDRDTFVAEWAMRRTRDNGVSALPAGWTWRIAARRAARRRPVTGRG